MLPFSLSGKRQPETTQQRFVFSQSEHSVCEMSASQIKEDAKSQPMRVKQRLGVSISGQRTGQKSPNRAKNWLEVNQSEELTSEESANQGTQVATSQPVMVRCWHGISQSGESTGQVQATVAYYRVPFCQSEQSTDQESANQSKLLAKRHPIRAKYMLGFGQSGLKGQARSEPIRTKQRLGVREAGRVHARSQSR